jgi:hypothetical protein
MAEKRTVTLPDELVIGAAKNKFVVGKTITLSDGREIEIRAGKPKFREAIAVGRAMGADADPVDVNLMLASRRMRVKGGEILSPEELLDLDVDDANLVMEEALGTSFLSRTAKASPPSSGTDSAPNISKE